MARSHVRGECTGGAAGAVLVAAIPAQPPGHRRRWHPAGPGCGRDCWTEPDRSAPQAARGHPVPGPSLAHWFGTDEVGRDIFARVVNGGRISISSALVAVAVGLLGGTLLGLIAGYLEGRIGLGIMAAMDLMLALPAILLAITIAARLGPGLRSAMIAAGLVGLPNYARLARASTLAVKRREYVQAAQALGASRARIMFRHVLPNILTPLIVQATIGVGNAILLVSALGYLGIGAQQPTPEWGGC